MLGPLNKRAFLKALGAAPIAAPLALKKAADNAAAQLNGLEISGVAAPNLPASHTDSSIKTLASKVDRFLLLGGKRKLISHLYRDNKYVGALDPDLAVLKAPSLSAKIAWQRKRNVEKRFQELKIGTYDWQELDNLLDNVLDTKGD